MHQGQLTEQHMALIVQLTELAGKVQGPSSYKALGDLLSALEQFKPVEEEDNGDDNASG